LATNLIVALSSFAVCWRDLGSNAGGTRKHSARCWISRHWWKVRCQNLAGAGSLQWQRRAPPPPGSPHARAFGYPATGRMSRQQYRGRWNCRNSVLFPPLVAIARCMPPHSTMAMTSLLFRSKRSIRNTTGNSSRTRPANSQETTVDTEVAALVPAGRDDRPPARTGGIPCTAGPRHECFGRRHGTGRDEPARGPPRSTIFQDDKDTLYRLHGSPEWWSIGKSVSSGCVRLIHQDIIDLYDRVPEGTPIVVRADCRRSSQRRCRQLHLIATG
jgi:hypothetical protein